MRRDEVVYRACALRFTVELYQRWLKLFSTSQSVRSQIVFLPILERTCSMKLKSVFITLLATFAINGFAAYPDKSIKFLVPWPPGGATDQVARILVQPLTKELGVSVFVENKGGAGGNIGTQAFVQDKPDGYSILMAIYILLV